MDLRSIVSAAALCALCAPSLAAEETTLDTGPTPTSPPAFDFRAGGSIRFDYFRSNRQLDDKTNFYGTTIQGKFEPIFSDNFDGKFEYRANKPDLVDRDAESEATLLEGYLTYRTDRTRIRFGKQIVAWGRTDGINPTDNLTPRNYTVLLPFEDDQRFGTTALTIDQSVGDDKTVSLFTSPYFEPNKIALPTSQADFVDQSPDHRSTNSELGIRLNKAGGSFDWSTSYFSGYSLWPDFHPLGISAVGKPVLGLNYDKIDVLGADIATNVGRYGLRGEIAYTKTSDNAGDDPFTKNSFLYYVFGGDRTFDDNLNINLQLFGRHVYNFSDPESIADPSTRSVAMLNAVVNNQLDKNSYGMTARISKKWLNDTLKAEVLTVVNFTRSNSYIRPLLTYDATDHLSLSVGADIFRGDQNTFFGSLKKNQGPYAEVKYSF